MPTDLRAIATNIFHRTLAAIDVEAVVRQALQRDNNFLTVSNTQIDLQPFARVVVIAVGKASVPMMRAAQNVLQDRLTLSLVATNAVIGETPQGQVFLGGHPLPNQGSMDAAEAALQLLRAANDEQTLVLFLLSGGGSALFETPIADAITLEDLQTINRVLVGCGAVIGEMNVVRRFLSAVKGGRLAEAASKARQISLYISDVNSDDLSTVSSGLTLPSTATRADFDRIVATYNLLEKFPPPVAALIAADNLPDMPPALSHETRTHHLLLDNRVALRIAQQIAEQDYNCVVEVADDLVEGDVEEMAQEHLMRLQTLREKHPGRTVCLLSGGEVICPVRGNGQGGRNQEFVLRAAMSNQLDSIAILSAGTDGIDGHSPAAGAIADETTLPRAAVLNLSPDDYLQRSDSFNFFHALGDAIIIGPTGNNVRDLRIFLA
jgi:hydroxypyruvate reductase